MCNKLRHVCHNTEKSFPRWRLQKAFYHPKGLGKTGCSGIGLHDICPLWTCLSRQQTSSLSLADLEETKPEYLSNIVVNRWQRDERGKENYELLIMSPKGIERLDHVANEELVLELQPQEIKLSDAMPNKEPFKGKLEPQDIKLSDATATSAAALSTHMGKYDKSVKGLTRLHTILGLEMGATMISDIHSVRKEKLPWKVCFFANFASNVMHPPPPLSLSPPSPPSPPSSRIPPP